MSEQSKRGILNTLGEPVVEHDGSKWVDYDTVATLVATLRDELVAIYAERIEVHEKCSHGRAENARKRYHELTGESYPCPECGGTGLVDSVDVACPGCDGEGALL